MSKEKKIKHKWRVSYVVNNVQKCRNCHAERRKVKDKFFYSCESKTYCENSDLELVGYKF